MPGNLELVEKLQRNTCFLWKTVQSCGLSVVLFFFFLSNRVRYLGCVVNLTSQLKTLQKKEKYLA